MRPSSYTSHAMTQFDYAYCRTWGKNSAMTTLLIKIKAIIEPDLIGNSILSQS